MEQKLHKFIMADLCGISVVFVERIIEFWAGAHSTTYSVWSDQIYAQNTQNTY